MLVWLAWGHGDPGEIGRSRLPNGRSAMIGYFRLHCHGAPIALGWSGEIGEHNGTGGDH